MTIREAEAGDARAVEDLYRELVVNPTLAVLPAQLAAIRADPRTHLLVAETNGRLVGTALLAICMDAMFGFAPYAVVENVVVAAASRGRGVGATLIRGIAEIARGASCTKIMLLSSAMRTDAHRFFAREGFDPDRKRGFVRYLPSPPLAILAE